MVISEADYVDKVETFLTQSGAVATKRFSFPSYKKRDHILTKGVFSSCNRNVRKFINESNLVIRERALKEALKVMNPSVPKLYGLIKTHKEGYPIRPVVSFVASPTYNLSRWLKDWFVNITDFTPKFAIKNSSDLVKKLTSPNLPPLPSASKVCSFDVNGMFTNIDVRLSINYMCDILRDSNVNADTISEFKGLISICVLTNICQFRNTTYQFPDGLPMGGPLSSLVAEVFMDRLENDIFTPDHPQFSVFARDIYQWYRYVDDILCIWTGSEAALQAFHEALNLYHPKLKFSLEKGGDSINYLDLSISLEASLTTNLLNLNFDIFRKSTYTGQSIHGDSMHHCTHKAAAFTAMAQRMVSLPLSSKNITKEKFIISEIARSNNIKIDVDKLVRKRRRAMALKRGSSLVPVLASEKTRWVRLPFLGRSSQNLARILKNYGFRTAFYSLHTLRNLYTPKDPTPLLQKSGVYKIECGDCDAVYIGQTGRALGERIAEHDSDANTERPESAFARHIVATGHRKTNKNVSLLHYSPKGRVLNRLEEIEIIKHKKLDNECTLLNDTEHVLFGHLLSFLFDLAHES